MTMENPRALVKIKESGDSCSFYLRFSLGVPESPRELTYLANVANDSIQSSDLDRIVAVVFLLAVKQL